MVPSLVRSKIPAASVSVCLALASTPMLASCTSDRIVVASRQRPTFCGGDFGMIEQMEDETRGTPTMLTSEDYRSC